MIGMFFKDILIADIDRHTAHYIQLNPGLNVVTSAENHVGKSSLVKSLYHALGAEVQFDKTWSKTTKITAVRFDVNGTEYRIIRFQRRFALLQENHLILLTDSVTRGLAPKFEELFNFSIYLAEKSESKKVIQAPPVFTFMPYYIDQDIGWKGLYESFQSLDQFEKKERIKSLYFHLGLYNKWTIEKMGERDRLKEEITALQERKKKISITLEALLEEIQNLVPAEDEKELEQQLSAPKANINRIVKAAGNVRNRVQRLQTTLQQHEYQLMVILEYQKIRTPIETEKNTIHVCPNCGYEFDEEIYSLVRNSYNQSNEEYLIEQINLIITSIRDQLNAQKSKYVDLMAELKEQEKVYDESQDAYDAYLRHRGLRETVRKYQSELTENKIAQCDREEKIKKINKELKSIKDKKIIEISYSNHVKSNIIKLGAWDASFEGNIKLLKPITAQGSREGKIILSQYIGLFQTMEEMQSSAIRFPFVVDSPRGMEASDASSRDILRMIAGVRSLPQVILATVDYEKFDVAVDAKIIKLDRQMQLLDESTYSEMQNEIESLYNLVSEDVK